MTKEALRLALEALETPWNAPYVNGCDLALGKKVKAIIAIKEALVNEALEKMAENARELGLDYEPEQDWIERERAVGYREGHQNALKQMAQPEQEPVACVEYIPCCTDQTCSKCKAATPPQRKPLTAEMTKQMRESCDSYEMRGAFVDGWLSAEAAHGIKGEA